MDFHIDKTLYSGRPSDETGRLQIELDVYDFLDKLKIEYKRVDHGPADCQEKCEQVGALIGLPYYKNLFLHNRCKKEYRLVMMEGNKPYNATSVSQQLGTSRLSFCSPDEMQQYLGVSPGSVTLIALMNDTNNKVTAAIDSDILNREYIRCHPCVNTSTLLLRTEDILNVFLPAINHNFIKIVL